MQISTSFVQDQPHVTKSARFVAIQPAMFADMLADHGFTLGHLKSARARLADRAHHQTTIARYVARDSADIVRTIGDGSSLDLLVRAPHLGGAVELRLGFFRGACANQWNAGKLVASVRVPHTGNCLETLNQAIPALVAKRDGLIESIGQMGSHTVTPAQVAGLAQQVAGLRMDGIEATRVHVRDLLRPRRPEDHGMQDLFTVANVLQENAIRFGMRYETAAGRNMVTRKVVETSATAVDLTGNIWEQAAALLDS